MEFDVIHVGAAAATIPDGLLRMLRRGGRMIIPVGESSQSVQLIKRTPSGDFTKEDLLGVRFVPLVNTYIPNPPLTLPPLPPPVSTTPPPTSPLASRSGVTLTSPMAAIATVTPPSVGAAVTELKRQLSESDGQIRSLTTKLGESQTKESLLIKQRDSLQTDIGMLKVENMALRTEKDSIERKMKVALVLAAFCWFRIPPPPSNDHKNRNNKKSTVSK
jgi:hypothetical protein